MCTTANVASEGVGGGGGGGFRSLYPHAHTKRDFSCCCRTCCLEQRYQCHYSHLNATVTIRRCSRCHALAVYTRVPDLLLGTVNVHVVVVVVVVVLVNDIMVLYSTYRTVQYSFEVSAANVTSVISHGRGRGNGSTTLVLLGYVVGW
jgi:hypothetical protein